MFRHVGRTLQTHSLLKHTVLAGVAMIFVSACAVKLKQKTATIKKSASSTLSLSGLTITDPSPTNLTTLHLSYAGYVGPMASYCFKENDTSITGCTWTSAAIPPLTYSPVANSGPLALTVFLKDSAGSYTSGTTSNTVILDQTPPTLSVTSPVGGEVWAAGSSHNITWTATDANGIAANSIGLSYTLDGTTWTSIASGLANSGTYSWTVPNVSSATAKVRVSANDVAGNTNTAQSAANFTINNSAPTVTVTSPNGGEYWAGGSSQNITWTATSAVGIAANSIVLDYSTDGGTTWTNIASAQANSGTYAWTVPSINNSTVKVRVTATDTSSISASDASNANFTIDSILPAVTVTSPNGAEVWAGGSSHNITWTATDANGVAANTIALDYTTDGGTTWTSIATGRPNSGTYSWTVPSINSTTVKVRVKATDVAGNVGNDLSDANFTIDSTAPSITVTAPNGGEIYKGGSSHNITWTATDSVGIAANSVSIDYTTDGTTWTSIASGLANSGTYSWTVPSINSTTVKVRVSANDTSGNPASDASDANFTIDSTAPAITVTSPNGAETWGGGSSHNITWTATDAVGVAANSVSIDYTTDGSTWTSVASGLANSGTYSWTVPSINSTTVKVRVSASDTAGNSGSDASDANFTISSTGPSVTVTAPNGSEIYKGGSSHNITWTATSGVGFGANPISIDYTTDGTTWTSIATAQANSGTYSWTVPSINSTTVKVRVTAVDNASNSGSDASDANFTIDSTAPAITVTSPNGGEKWAGGSSHNITWTATDANGIAVNSVSLDYTTDGTTWTSIATAQANSGSYSWTVPGIDSTTVKVRVTALDTAGNSGSDVSDANFLIDSTAPALAVTSPNGAEVWGGGSSHNITWTATDANGIAANSVSLDYTTDGTTWTSIASGLANSGTYSWTVPSINSTTVKVRATATDAAGNSGSDASDANFTISSTGPTVTVTAPNGSEIYKGGSSHNITWTATSAVGIAANSIAVAYSTDGSTWTSIATGLANSGTYSWTVPSINSTTVTVKVTATDNASNTGSDVSDANFTIDSTAPAIAVTSPNGGEKWKGGSSHNITWTATDANGIAVNSVAIDYTTDGTTWTSVATAQANSGSYSWTVPSIDSATVKVRVTALDTAGNSGSDASDANFTIDSTAPALAVTSPNGAETWAGGSSHNITWTATDANGIATNSVSLDYTTDGTTWTSIASGLANSGTYAWTLPTINSTTVKVRATATDVVGNSGSDASDANFTISTAAPAVTVTAPNGGEVYKGGSSHNITWTATSGVGLAANPISIDYTTDGTTWNSIATGLANSGTYSWTVPGIDSTTVKVRVSAVDTVSNTGTDASDANFTIDSTAPAITVTSPNGGEKWKGGASKNITWTATDAVGIAANSVSIDYTTDGTTWTSIATAQANSGTYSWTVPSLDTSTVKVRVTALDTAGNSGSDASDANFTIDSTAPNLAVTSPNGAEVWGGGSSHNITWTASDTNGIATNSVSLDYTTDGTTWTSIASGLANTGTYAWTVPSINSTTVKVRVTASDVPGNSGSDASDANFTISSTGPTVTVTAPNGGEKWKGGASKNITWTATSGVGFGATAISIDYTTDGTTWNSIATGLTNSGTYAWTVPSIDSTTVKVRVTAVDNASNSGSDVSDANFTIDSTAPALTVTAPNGGEKWKGGSSQNITWTATDANGIATNSVSLDYTTDGTTWNSIATGLANSGTYSWTVPSIDSATVKVRATALDTAGNSGSDASNANFMIDSTAPALAVTSPNGGEMWQGGSSHNITWTATDGGSGIAANSVSIDYTTDGTTWNSIATAQANSGTYSWTVPSITSSTVKVRVTALDNAGNSGSDASDANFSIDSAGPTITVTSPNGGEIWKGGASKSITWTATDTGGVATNSVSIDYTTDGTTWNSIATTLANSGTYSWTVPSINSTTVKVRVTALDTAGNSGSDASDANFTIDSTAPTLTVTSPNGAEDWSGGSSHNITWTSSDTSGFTANSVSLDYTTDGTTWTSIATAQANSGTYSWTLPSIDSSTVKVRVTALDAAGNSGSDASDANFIIDSSPPTIAITSPNGGEAWIGGSSHNITWTATDPSGVASSIALDYTTDGTTWNSIATGLSNSGSYAWTLPNISSTTVKVRMTAADSLGHSTTDASDANFAITATFTDTIPYTAGTEASYSYNTTYTQFTGGNVELKKTNLNDQDNSSLGWGTATLKGIAYDSGRSVLRLKTDGTCDGSLQNCNYYGSDWTPQYSSIASYFKFDAVGSIADAATVTAAIGSNGTAHNTNGTGFRYYQGKVGNGLDLDGVDDYVSTSIPMTTFNSSFTFSGWVLDGGMNSAAYSPVMLGASAQTSTTNRFYCGRIDGNSGGLRFWTGDVATCYNQEAYPDIRDNRWHQITCVWDSVAQKKYIYLDGVAQATNCSSSNGSWNMADYGNLQIGNGSIAGSIWKGRIDETAAWTKALNASEISFIYQRQRAFYGGSILSRISDALSTGASWTGMLWTPGVPSGKPLNDFEMGVNVRSEANYPYQVGSMGGIYDNDTMTGIQHIWHLFESSGTVRDKAYIAGGGVEGTIHAGMTKVPGKFGNAMHGATVDLASTVTLAGDFTISGWARSFQTYTVSNGEALVGMTGASPNLNFYNGYLRLYNGTGDVVVSDQLLAPSGDWVHYAVTRSGTTVKLYTNGRLSSTGTWAGSMNFDTLGCSTRGTCNLEYQEIAVWSRAKIAAEVLQLYQRGANNLKFQVRTCANSDCSDGTWMGTDGGIGTFFTEFNDNYDPVNQTSTFSAYPAYINFAPFPSPPPTNRYAQYRAILESDDANGTQCNYGSGASPCLPEVARIMVLPEHYSNTRPTVVYNTASAYVTLTGFSLTAGGSGCTDPRVTLSPDNSTWYYWNGSAWAVSDDSDAKTNTPAAVNTNIAAYGTARGAGNVYVKVYLKSDGVTACQIDSVTVSGTR